MTTGPGTGRLSTSEAARNEHEALMAVLTRPPRTPLPDCEVGQDGRTKEWIVKSVHVPMNEGEGWGPWARRVGEITAALVAELPKSPIDVTPGEAKRRINAKPSAQSEEVPF